MTKRNTFQQHVADKFLQMAGDLPHINKDIVIDIILRHVFDENADANFISLLKAKSLLQDKRYDDALPFARKAFNPDNRVAKEILATCLFETGHYEEAAPLLAEEIPFYREDTFLRFQYAYCLFKTGDRCAGKLLQATMVNYDDLVAIYPNQMKDVFQSALGALARQRKPRPQTPK